MLPSLFLVFINSINIHLFIVIKMIYIYFNIFFLSRLWQNLYRYRGSYSVLMNLLFFQRQIILKNKLKLPIEIHARKWLFLKTYWQYTNFSHRPMIKSLITLKGSLGRKKKIPTEEDFQIKSSSEGQSILGSNKYAFIQRPIDANGEPVCLFES